MAMTDTTLGFKSGLEEQKKKKKSIANVEQALQQESQPSAETGTANSSVQKYTDSISKPTTKGEQLGERPWELYSSEIKKEQKILEDLRKEAEGLPKNYVQEYLNRIDKAEAEYQQDKQNVNMQEAVDMFVKNLSQLGAAMYGAKKGVNMSGIKGTDMSGTFERKRKELETDYQHKLSTAGKKKELSEDQVLMGRRGIEKSEQRLQGLTDDKIRAQVNYLNSRLPSEGGSEKTKTIQAAISKLTDATTEEDETNKQRLIKEAHNIVQPVLSTSEYEEFAVKPNEEWAITKFFTGRGDSVSKTPEEQKAILERLKGTSLGKGFEAGQSQTQTPVSPDVKLNPDEELRQVGNRRAIYNKVTKKPVRWVD